MKTTLWLGFVPFFAAVPFLAWAAAVDLKDKIIPNRAVFGTALAGLARIVLARIVWPEAAGAVFWESLGGAVLVVALFLVLGWITKGGVGEGDVKLGGALGLLWGWPAVAWVVALASLFGSVWGRLKRERSVPMAPHFLAGHAAVLVFGLVGLFLDGWRWF